MANQHSRIFISYSHRANGPDWKAWLARHLAVFERHHLLDVWDDERIRASQSWDTEIKQAMSDARLAILLLTPEALQSDYILNTELPFLRARWEQDKIPVFPIICEPCRWKEQKESEWLRAIQSPAGAEPLSGFQDDVADRHLRDVATSIANELSRVSLATSERERAGASGQFETRTCLDKFPLTRSPGLREEKLIGREQELALLDLAFASASSPSPPSGERAGVRGSTAIVSLVAWGGVGKTMLVQHWLQRLQREGWFGAQRVYAWSFYSQGTKEDRQASEDSFLAHALEWFGVQCEPTLSPWDKGRLLADAVARERTLLILDGIEPLQYPPGPMGGQLRAPGVQSLLKHLARKSSSLNSQPSTLNQALCLVTTREPLTDLADFQRREGSPWGSVLRVDLGNLTDEAGAALLHHAGANRAGAAEIEPDDKELLAASREVDGHALTLNLLGRFLARAHGGDIRRRDLVKFEEADRQEQGGTTFKMLAAFENWFAVEGDIEARALTILRLLGLFDRPADEGCMAALRKPPVILGFTEPLFMLKRDSGTGQTVEQSLSDKAWNDATHFLSDFGLIVIHADSNGNEWLLDCHPLIREHFAEQQRNAHGEAWRLAHTRLFEHLQLTVQRQTDGLDSLQPLFQAVTHGCRASVHQKACDEVYWARISRGRLFYSTRKLGAYSDDLATISCFFDNPWNLLSPNISEAARPWLLNQAGHRLRALGRLSEAIEPLRAAFDIYLRQEVLEFAAATSVAMSEASLSLGEINGAVANGVRSIELADQTHDTFQELIARVAHGSALHQAGGDVEASERFAQAESLQAERDPQCPSLVSWQGFLHCELLLSVIERVAWRAYSLGGPSFSERESYAPAIQNGTDVIRRSVNAMAWLDRAQHASLLDRALPVLAASRAALYVSLLSFDADRAKSCRIGRTWIEAAVIGVRSANTMDLIPVFLLSRALAYCLSDNPNEALQDLDEAWDIAERGPMRLHMADIHLYRARLFFREKPYPWKSPQDDLAAAEKLINECGYHRRDEELADARKAILGTQELAG